MRAKQTDFFLHNSNHSFRNSKKYSHSSAFGGSSLKSHPKTARPISTKHLMHVVLKSAHAKGQHSFLRIERELTVLIKRLGHKLNIQIKDTVIMTNHIHLAVKTSHRRAFRAFLRALGGLIVRKILKIEKTTRARVKGLKKDTPIVVEKDTPRVAEKNTPLEVVKFFTGRPFSRIVAAGRKSFSALAQYFALNRLEKCGYSKEASRERGLLEFCTGFNGEANITGFSGRPNTT